jgi:hypothetical protein
MYVFYACMCVCSVYTHIYNIYIYIYIYIYINIYIHKGEKEVFLLDGSNDHTEAERGSHL